MAEVSSPRDGANRFFWIFPRSFARAHDRADGDAGRLQPARRRAAAEAGVQRSSRAVRRDAFQWHATRGGARRGSHRAALSERALAAAEAPLEAAGDMLRALSIAEKSTRLAKRELASDVLGGADLLAGSIAAALRNVDINLPALATDELRERVRAQ